MNKYVAIVMAGGRATRMGGIEKALAPLCGKAMVEWILDAAENCAAIGSCYTVTSSYTPETTAFLKSKKKNIMVTKGNGYVEDMKEAIKSIRPEHTVMMLSCDMPLLTADMLGALAAAYEKNNAPPAMSLYIPSSLLHSRHAVGAYFANIGGTEAFAAGINLIRPEYISDAEIPDIRILLNLPAAAINVNTEEDLLLAAKILCESEKQNSG